MRKGAWFWLGWACLTGAVLGVFDQWFPIGPAVQLLLIGAGILFFHLAGSRPNGETRPGQPSDDSGRPTGGVDGGESGSDELEIAVDLLASGGVLDAANQAFARLRDDPAAWRAERIERAFWDEALAD